MRPTIEPFARALRRSTARFRADMAGNVAIIGAAFLSTAMIITAFAVDEGALYLEKRRIQNITDIAAIAAAANPTNAEASVRQALADNGLLVIDRTLDQDEMRDWLLEHGDRSNYRIELGSYSPDAQVAAEYRFLPNQTPTNAVKVTLQKSGTLFFAERIMDKPLISASGIAYASSQAAFSVGSRLLSLDGGILNGVLNGLLGTEISLEIMDYEALVDVRIDALSFMKGMATELDITSGTYNDVLESSATIGQIASVMADLAGPLDLTAAAALRKIAADDGSDDVSVPLGKLLELGTFGARTVGTEQQGTTAAVEAMQMLTAAAAIANGEHQVELDLGLVIPGVASTTVKLAIGEPMQHAPWMSIGDGSEIVRTAQTRLLIEAKVGGKGVLSGVGIHLPIYLELAYAEATLAKISCPTGRVESAKVTIDAKPGVAELWIGDIDAAKFGNFGTSPVKGVAKLVDVAAIKVKGDAHVAATNTVPKALVFDYEDIENLTVKSVSTSNLVETAVSSLLDDLDLQVNVAGISLGLPALVKGAVASTLAPVAAPLDAVVYNLLLALGIKIGEADVRVHGVSCQRAVLVQ
jgi:uncharacterized membrane protein